MDRPTADEWVERIGVAPTELPDGVWRVTLSDGQLFYKLSKNRIGPLYIDEIYGISDDPDVAARIKTLQQAIARQSTNLAEKTSAPTANLAQPRGAKGPSR
ncbi:MAG: hypothetical protein M5U15_00390 [Kiritimatiellae bacterium]|nr:hypothetical protein [Kiritimatiellia bacterium]